MVVLGGGGDTCGEGVEDEIGAGGGGGDTELVVGFGKEGIGGRIRGGGGGGMVGSKFGIVLARLGGGAVLGEAAGEPELEEGGGGGGGTE